MAKLKTMIIKIIISYKNFSTFSSLSHFSFASTNIYSILSPGALQLNGPIS